ncbi:MAG: hypothetical protein IT372_01505, partial [Polyangiaceae bacterium]|nr:hypothetical protein [Polyangiaceae bacterium]
VDKDLRIELTLDKAAGPTKPAAAPPRAAAPPPPPPPPADDMKRPTAKPVRPIDTTNPFAAP